MKNFGLYFVPSHNFDKVSDAQQFSNLTHIICHTSRRGTLDGERRQRGLPTSQRLRCNHREFHGFSFLLYMTRMTLIKLRIIHGWISVRIAVFD
jgi:hypothetical protein